jgi:hypothetical protein
MTPEQSRAHTERAEIARSARDRLNRLVPRIEISWAKPPPAGARVTLDGTPVEDSSFDRPQSVDPGLHVIQTRIPGLPGSTRRVSLQKRQSVRIVLPISGPASKGATKTTSVPTAGGGQRTFAYIVGGVGLAAVAAGTVTGILTLAKASQVNSHCRDVQSERAACDDKGLSDSNSAIKLGNVSTVSFVVGGVTLGTALILLLTAPSKTPLATTGDRHSWRFDLRGTSRAAQFTLERRF